MRVAVVTSSPPMSEGGHLVIARSLVTALRESGHEAEIILTPQNRFGRQAAAYLATWLTDVGTAEDRRIDQVISLRFPSYAVRHERHACWLNHTMREYYDQWERFSASLSAQGRIKERIRRTLIQSADRYLLTKNVDKLFVQSRTIQKRLELWPELRSTVLYPPAPQRPYRCDRYGDYVLWYSRLAPLKRADLFVEALATPEAAGVNAVIAGEGEEHAHLEGMIRRHSLQHRVLLAGRVDEDGLLKHLGECRAVCFPPWQEDYGLVTVEAFASRKAVLTCSDSGGPAELVQNGVNGFVCDPTPASLAFALRRIVDDKALAEGMGAAAYASGRKLNWPDTVRALTS